MRTKIGRMILDAKNKPLFLARCQFRSCFLKTFRQTNTATLCISVQFGCAVQPRALGFSRYRDDPVVFGPPRDRYPFERCAANAWRRLRISRAGRELS